MHDPGYGLPRTPFYGLQTISLRQTRRASEDGIMGMGEEPAEGNGGRGKEVAPRYGASGSSCGGCALGKGPRLEGGKVEMLRAVFKHWFSHDITVFDHTGQPLAQADLSNWRERTKLEIGGAHYEASTQRREAKEFLLEDERGQRVAVVEKKVEEPSTWKERFLKSSEGREHFLFEHGGNRYELRKESTKAYVITREGVGSVGSIRHKGGWFSREWTVDLPEELPLEVKVFLVWVVVVLWRREKVAAASGGSSAVMVMATQY
jgi:hypothetical protein